MLRAITTFVALMWLQFTPLARCYRAAYELNGGRSASEDRGGNPIDAAVEGLLTGFDGFPERGIAHRFQCPVFHSLRARIREAGDPD
jgi:hypothetical protein